MTMHVCPHCGKRWSSDCDCEEGSPHPCDLCVTRRAQVGLGTAAAQRKPVIHACQLCGRDVACEYRNCPGESHKCYCWRSECMGVQARAGCPYRASQGPIVWTDEERKLARGEK